MSFSNPPGGIAAMLTQKMLSKMDPTRIPLKKRPQPYTGPEPKVVICYRLYPHIIENIVFFAKKEALLVLRVTCKSVCELVDRQFAHHIDIECDAMDLHIKARWLGRIPALRFKGYISLGATPFPRNAATPDIAGLEQLFMEQSPGGLGFMWRDVWFRMAPSSVAWFKKFMKQVHIVDMNGGAAITCLPMPYDIQIKCDPWGRTFVDTFPVPLIRMYPDVSGEYTPVVPFTSRWLIHVVQLEDPSRPASLTWFHTAPYIPEGTEQLAICLHIHPDLPSTLSTSGPLKYPKTLKKVVIELAIFPTNGTQRVTLNSFKALGLFWIKVFTNFRPGIEIHVHNIHQWDSVQHLLPMNTRDYLVVLFCALWMGEKVTDIDIQKLWVFAYPHLKFARGSFQFSDDEQILHHVNPDGSLMVKPDGTPSIVKPDVPTRYHFDGTPVETES